MLPQKVYEALRWIISIVIPALSVLLSTLVGAWGWNLPLDAVLATLSAVALFLGTIFGISKVVNDKSEETGD